MWQIPGTPGSSRHCGSRRGGGDFLGARATPPSRTGLNTRRAALPHAGQVSSAGGGAGTRLSVMPSHCGQR